MDLSLILSLLYISTTLFIIILVITNNGDPVKTISWILVLVLLPIVGILLYFFLGHNLRRNKFLNRKEILDEVSETEIDSSEFIRTGINDVPINLIEDNRTICLLKNNSNSQLSLYNNLKIILNGACIFAEIKLAIEEAQHHIHLDFYKIQPGREWSQILELLLKKASQGVSVRIIYDDVGSWEIRKSYTKKLLARGVEMKPFLPVFLPRFANKLNYRNHRKIVIIDGHTAFTGGFNIADYYVDGIKKLGEWYDIAIKITGESVKNIQKIFLMDWIFVKGEKIKLDPNIFPKTDSNGSTPIQITRSGPDSDWSSIMQAYFSAIMSAKKYVYLSTPYFMPNESILTALKTIALSNRTVRLVIPHKGDSKIVNLATQSYISELLDAGIEVYLFKNGFNHGKFIIVDGRMCTIGTANIDIRSFDHDFELNAIIYDKEVSRELEKTFHSYTSSSHKLSHESWDKRSLTNKFLNSTARILSPLF